MPNLFDDLSREQPLATHSRGEHLQFDRIILAKGSASSPDRRRLVDSIVALYPEAKVEERLDTPHNQIDLGIVDPLKLHEAGKRTLVFGELKTAVRFSEEEGNTCPNYWHFSPYGFCPYGCKYCYLAGTRGVWHSPSVKIYVNLPEMLGRIDVIARKLARPTAFYLGKLQDGLALDPLTGYSRTLVPFFAEHPYARQVILTKSASIGNLLDLDHRGNTILSWSVNPPDIATQFEANVPTVAERIDAMRRCAEKGYPVRAVIMPVIPVEGRQRIYSEFVADLLTRVPVNRLTIGGICSYRNAKMLMERKMTKSNVISANMASSETGDGRMRYAAQLRRKSYAAIIESALELRPELQIALCLEEREVWAGLDLENNIGRCNCVL